MQQGTQEWLAWRKSGVGASESAAILGLCPYSTPLDVFKNKTVGSDFKGNFATMRGQELEAKARARYELISMEDMPPATATHPKFTILRASLDGFRSDGKLILEIKCPSQATHDLAKSGKLPDHYMIQVQHQLLVTGADACHYFTYSDKDESHALVEVLPDLKLQGEIVAKCLDFWKLVESNTPPPLTERDYKLIAGNVVLEHLCQKIIDGVNTLEKKALNAIKAEAVQFGGHPKIKCGRVSLSTVNRLGVFSYHKLTIDEAT